MSPPPFLPSARPRRSRRLRKKLHIGEFRELGFAVHFRLCDDAPADAADAFWDAFIGMIESRALAFGGGDSGGFVTKTGRGTATEADREAVRAWLVARSGVTDVVVGALEDAWYAVAPGRE